MTVVQLAYRPSVLAEVLMGVNRLPHPNCICTYSRQARAVCRYRLASIGKDSVAKGAASGPSEVKKDIDT